MDFNQFIQKLQINFKKSVPCQFFLSDGYLGCIFRKMSKPLQKAVALICYFQFRITSATFNYDVEKMRGAILRR